MNSPDVPPLLTVVIPCFNERETIREILRRVRQQPIVDVEIIVVDDCSTDGTRDLLPDLCTECSARLIMHERNMGKGAALRTGFRAATGDIVIVQDADLEYDPAEYGRIIEPILQGRADVVYGSRFMGSHAHRVVYFWHMVGNTFLTLLSNMLTNINLTDMETCYKAFRRELIQGIRIEEDRFGFEPEITAKVARAQARIYEVGISYHGRTYAEGKKIGWRDGIRAIYAILKYNLVPAAPCPRRRMRFRLAFVAIIAAALALAAWNVATPGLYFDEMLFANAALGCPTPSFVTWQWHGIPILLMDYIGALKSWIYFPWFALVPVEPWSVRMPAIILGVAGAAAMVVAAARLFGRRAAAFAAPLVLLDPTLLMHSRIDWGPTALMFLCRGLVLMGIAAWWRRGTPAGLWLAVVAGAAGVFDKLNFIWILAAAVAALLVTAGRRLPAYAAKHRGSACLQAAIVLAVLVGGLWRAASLVAAGLGPAAQGLAERLVVAGRLLGLAVVGGGPLHVVSGDGMRMAAWMVPAYCVVAAALALGWPRVRSRIGQREWLFTLVFTLGVLVAFALTKSAEGPHHSAVVAGLPGLLLASLLAACASSGSLLKPRSRIARAAALGGGVTLAACMFASSVVSVRAFAHPSNRNFDPALNSLATVTAAWPDAVYRTCAWGIGTQLIGMTRGRVRIDDNWPEFSDERQTRAALERRDRSRDLFLIDWADAASSGPRSSRGLPAALAALGLEAERARTLMSVDGTPLIEFLRIPREAAPDGAGTADAAAAGGPP